MVIKASVHRFLTMFLILGQSNNNSAANRRPNKMRRLKLGLQRCSLWVLCSTILIASIANIVHFLSVRNTSFEFTAYNITLISKILICCVTIASILLCPDAINELWTQISDLDQYMIDVIKCEWRVGKFEHHFIGNVLTVTTLFTIRLVLKYWFRPPDYMLDHSMGLIPTVYSMISQLHVQFYLDLYVNILKSVNNKLSSIPLHADTNKFDSNASMVLLHEIQTLKLLHLKLWRACNQFNKCFSLILLSIIMQTITHVIPPLYVIVVDFIILGFNKSPRLLSK